MNFPNAGGGVAPSATQAANFHPFKVAGERDEERDGARPEEAPAGESSSATLEEAARGEREYVRGRLAEELGREPSEDELNEWLRRHTEGY